MAGFKDYDAYDGLGLAELIAKRQVSPEDVLEEAIARSERVNPTINAIVADHADYAREQVRKGLPEAKHPAPFRGVPFLLKDLHVTLKGTVTTYGSALYKDYVADHDATLTTRYKAAGFAIFGKTNTPEFGQTATTEPKLFGPSRNPWNTEHTPGGSSGGASAAVAAGIVPIAHASDGGGSIRGPASACGLFGFKPTRARTPMGPTRGEGWGGLSINHVVSRTVRDSAAALDATHGAELGDPYAAPPPQRPFLAETQRPPGRLRIAFSTQSPLGTPVDPECVSAVTNAAKLCEELGHIVEEATPELDNVALARTMGPLMSPNVANACEARAAALGRDLNREDVEAITWNAVHNGKKISAADYVNAITLVHQAGRTMAQFHQTYDVLIEPTYGQPPCKLGYLDMNTDDPDEYLARIIPYTPFTARYNMTGQPSMSMPLHWSVDHLPVGVMFSGRYGEDGLLYSLAAQIEHAQPWGHRRPPVHASG